MKKSEKDGTQLKEELDKLQKRNDSQLKEIEQLKGAVSEKDEKIADNNSTIDDLKSLVAVLEKSLKTEKDKVTDIQKKHSDEI